MKRLMVLVLASAAWAEEGPAEAKKYMGGYAARIVAEATEVEAVRIQRTKEHREPKSLEECEEIYRTKELDKEFLADARAALFEPKNYRFGIIKMCVFDPGVAIRFRKGSEHVDVLFCFSCDQVRFSSMDPKAAEAASVLENTDPGREVFLKLAKRAFPEDQAILGLRLDPVIPDTEAGELLGYTAVRILGSSTRVETFRIDRNTDPEAGNELFHGHRVVKKGPEMDQEFAEKLERILVRKGTCSQMPKECKFRPGVALRICSGPDALDVLLCFECNDLKIFSVDHISGEPIRRILAFDPARAELLKLAQEAFPDDEDLK